MDLHISQWPSVPTKCLRKDILATIRHGIDITLEYLNEANSKKSARLVQKRAHLWAKRYFGTGYYSFQLAKSPLFLDFHPDIFNLNVPSYERFRSIVPKPRIVRPSRRETLHSRQVRARHFSPEPDHRNPDEMERFPEYTEPTPASGQQLDEIVDFRPRRRPGTEYPPRISAQDLSSSALLTELPEFIARLASSNLKLETEAAEAKARGERPDHLLELDEEEAAEREHINVDVFPGVLEPQEPQQLRIPGRCSPENEPTGDGRCYTTFPPATKRKRIVLKKTPSVDAESDDSDQGEYGERFSKRQRTEHGHELSLAADTSSSDPETTSDEDSSEEDLEEARDPPDHPDRPTSRDSNSSRGSKLSTHASSEGVRIRLLAPVAREGHENGTAGPDDARKSVKTRESPTTMRMKVPSEASLPLRETRLPSEHPLIQVVKEEPE